MLNINDYVIYGPYSVCKIINIEKDDLSDKEYYILESKYNHCMIRTPVCNNKEQIRPVMNENEAKSVIESMPEMDTIWIDDIKERSNQYNKLIDTGKISDLVKVIKTLYLRLTDCPSDKKVITPTDKVLLEKAQKKLYAEFSVSLNLPNEQVETYLLQYI